MAERRHAVAEALAVGGGLDGVPCRVLLFGSRARGDWDGYSDADRLVVAQARQQAGVGDDVIAISRADWQAAAHSASPYRRSIHAQAIPIDATPPAQLFHRSDAQQAIAMAQAVLKGVADLDRPTG